MATPRRPTASFSLHGTLMIISRTTAGVYLQSTVQQCTAHACCCTLMHQGAVGLRGGCERDLGWAPSPLPRPTPPEPSVLQSPQNSLKSGMAAGQSGRLSCRVARNVQPTCPPAPPQCCPVGGVSGCLGCLENFSETPGHPVCFGLCSTHHTPSAHPHHTTSTPLRPSPPTVQHACMYTRTLPPLYPGQDARLR